MSAGEYRYQVQQLRAQADELEQRANQLQRAEQLRYQAQQLTAQADAISAKHAPPAAAPAPQQEQADKQPADFIPAAFDYTNPEHVARWVAASWSPGWARDVTKNAA